MKKVLSIVASAALIAAATSAGAASIQGTKHDLSNKGADPTLRGNGTQICVYCHTPHNARTEAPLWNRTDSTKSNTTYTLYSGLGMANRSSKSMTADSVSLFCMSCHDGSILGALVKNNYALEKGDTTQVLSTKSLVGKNSDLYKGTGDMRSTHPINFPVAIGSDTIQNDLQAVTSGRITGGSAAASNLAAGVVFPLFKSARSLTQTLECSSCHSVHDNANQPFLRATMAGSSLCLGCHAK